MFFRANKLQNMKLAMDVDGWWTDVDYAHVDVLILADPRSTFIHPVCFNSNIFNVSNVNS